MKDLKFSILLILITLIGLVNIIWLARLEIKFNSSIDLQPLKDEIADVNSWVESIFDWTYGIDESTLLISKRPYFNPNNCRIDKLDVNELTLGVLPNEECKDFFIKMHNDSFMVADKLGNFTGISPKGIITSNIYNANNEPVSSYATKAELRRVYEILYQAFTGRTLTADFNDIK